MVSDGGNERNIHLCEVFSDEARRGCVGRNNLGRSIQTLEVVKYGIEGLCVAWERERAGSSICRYGCRSFGWKKPAGFPRIGT